MDFLFMLDSYYWLIVGPAFLLALIAQVWVKASFAKWSRVGIRSGLTGAQAAYEILRRNGVTDVDIKAADGFLSDHFNPRTRTLALSAGVYGQPTVSAVGVAAHEAGHALQHAKGSVLMGIRSILVPVAAAGNIAIWLIMIGLMLNFLGLAKLGVFLFAGAVLFQIVTLPVELDASRRAAAQLAETGILTSEELSGAKAVLFAAAMTYVAAAAVSVSYLIYFLLRTGALSRRD